MIELQWREVEPGNRGFQLAPPEGREYDLWFREGPIHIEGNIYTLPGEWAVVIMPIQQEPKP